MNEDKTERAINRGQQADMLLRNELLQEAFSKLEESYIAAWRTSSPMDSASREKLWLAINQVGKVKDHLGKVLASGRLAQTELRMRTKQPR